MEPMTGQHADLRANGIVDAWVAAECRGDVSHLRRALDDDFVGVTAEGGALDKTAWLARYRRGELVNHAFVWRTRHWTRRRGVLIALGELDQVSSYRGRDASAALTAIAVVDLWRGRVLGVHCSAVASEDDNGAGGDRR
jgi:hypothetical protein